MSELGGAIYIYENEDNKRYNYSPTKYMISNTKFSNNVANIGGALYLDNVQNCYIKGCTFAYNTVQNSTKNAIKALSGSGGALYYTCEPDFLNCKLNIESTYFLGNYAAVKGGAIYWDILEPVMTSDTFSSNKAFLYGDNIGCFP